jgi:hypothetical protein
VAASPLEPAGGVAGWFRAAEGGGEQALDLADGQRDQPGVGGLLLRVTEDADEGGAGGADVAGI